ncbi:TOBE domain-containing protein [Spirabiliibacterium falconis]|uniref:TOBE domain-containing protein n=1 Tax=Spirabiliibacterium falconis TaxID=572023 RepID=UPI001AAD0ED1|nr:TOBE domain-containing protein [Spirabiliibacterium falconis]MBE2895233.1 TOBE domain-containing protein [Spirabiliibacterium falconis]
MTEKNIEIDLSIKLQQQCFVDPRRIALLQHIDTTGSIAQAAKQINLSYKTAWDSLNAMEAVSPKPLLLRNTGGKEGGGTQLTDYAKRILKLYHLLEQAQQRAFTLLQDESIPLTSLLAATARFGLQSSARNQLFGQVVHIEDHYLKCNVSLNVFGFETPLIVSITKASQKRLNIHLGQELLMMFKAPWINISYTPCNAVNTFTGTIKNVTTQQDTQEVLLAIDRLVLCASSRDSQIFNIGEQVYFTIDPEKIILLAL